MGTTRFTRQRAELLAVLDEVGTFQTPLQIYRELRTRGVICRSCAAAVEVSSVMMERWAATTGSDNGFVDVSHTLEIFGLCAHCSPRVVIQSDDK